MLHGRLKVKVSNNNTLEGQEAHLLNSLKILSFQTPLPSLFNCSRHWIKFQGDFCVPLDCWTTVAMLEGLPCKIIYICFVMSTFVCWALVMFLISFFSISIMERLREAGVVAMRLHHAGLLAVHLREVAYIRLAWSEEKMFEMSSMLLCFFVILSACLLIISRGKCHPESVPVPGKS